MTNVVSHWDEAYHGMPVKAPDPEDPVLVAALEHFGEVANRRLLDLGFGTGEASLFFANHGASVVSIETSKVAVDNLKAYCAEHNVSNVTPIHMSATDIADVGPFDFIFGSFILHHIEPFDEFVRTLRAALRLEGRAFFYENNAQSSLLMWFRRHVVGKLWVAKQSDAEEYPLTPEEVELLSRYFNVRVHYPELFFLRLISTHLLHHRGFDLFRKLDDLLYRVPVLRRYTYRQYILLS